ncbi:hypothetical protein Tco_0548818, partial [Tanacetum coccineum]
MGEGSAMPTDPHHTPIITQPSSSQPQRKQKSRRPKEKDTQAPQSNVPSDPTNIADEAIIEEPSIQLKELMDFCTKLQQRALDLENTKTAQAQEITSLKKRDMAEKEVSTADPVTTAGEVVTTNVEVNTASPTAVIITNVELTLAQTLVELKSARPKTKWVVMQEPSESTPTISLQLPSQVKGQGSKDKAKVEADYQLAQRLQAQEQEELSDAEKATLFVQLLEKRRIHFVAKRAEEKRNRSPTKAQQRNAFDREDLEVLWSIVKARFKKTEPVNYMDIFLHLNLKTMFEHHLKDSNILYYLLVEKMYPLTKHTLHQMFNDVKLQVDYKCEMTFELLRLVKKQLKEGYGMIVRIKSLLEVTAVKLDPSDREQAPHTPQDYSGEEGYSNHGSGDFVCEHKSQLRSLGSYFGSKRFVAVKYISDPIISLYEVSLTGLPARSGPKLVGGTMGVFTEELSKISYFL